MFPLRYIGTSETPKSETVCTYKGAAEQKARTTYENLLRLADDPDVKDVLRYLREREIVHYQRFAEGLGIIQDKLDDRNFYAFNPAFRTPKKM